MTYAATCRAGIYMIRNSVTGDSYYGSAVNLRRRSQTHTSALRNNRHGNARLQNAWNKYGEDAFTFTVLAVLERDEVLAAETRLLAKHFGDRSCYNLSPVAGAPMAGRTHTPEALARIVASSTGRTHSDATKAKMSAWQKGCKRDAAHVARMATLNLGKTRSVESRDRQSASLKKSWSAMTPEARATRLAGCRNLANRRPMKGQVFTPEHRAKIAETKRLRRVIGFACGQYAASLVAA